MLVLSRKIDEVIEIDGGIKITIVDIRGDKVRVGIVAPKEVKVDRSEVAEAIREEQKSFAERCDQLDLSLISLPAGELRVYDKSGLAIFETRLVKSFRVWLDAAEVKAVKS